MKSISKWMSDFMVIPWGAKLFVVCFYGSAVGAGMVFYYHAVKPALASVGVVPVQHW